MQWARGSSKQQVKLGFLIHPLNYLGFPRNVDYSTSKRTVLSCATSSTPYSMRASFKEKAVVMREITNTNDYDKTSIMNWKIILNVPGSTNKIY